MTTNRSWGRKTSRGFFCAALGTYLSLGCSPSDSQPRPDAGSAGDRNIPDSSSDSGSDAGASSDAGAANSDGGRSGTDSGGSGAEPAGGTDAIGGGSGGTNAGSGGTNAGSGGTNAGSGGTNAGSGGTNAGSGGTNAGSGGTNAGSGGTNAGSGGTNAGSGGTSAGFGGTSAGSGGTSAGSGGTSAGFGGTSAGFGGTSAGSGGTSAGSGGTSGGNQCIAESHPCASGSCVPAPCHVGTLTCGDVPTCVDSLVTLPAGTSCGAGSVCSSTGSCDLVKCTPIPANLPNCVADKPCHIGNCQPNATVCSDLTELLNFGVAGNGTPCGVPNVLGVCAQGECIVPHCLANDGACDVACVNNVGAALPEGARCGVNAVCLTGKCTAELQVIAAPFTFVPQSSFCGVVAHLTDSKLTDTTSTLVAKIIWGDTGPNSTSVGTITGSTGTFTIGGNHVYAQSGTYQVGVQVTDLLTGAVVQSNVGVNDKIVEFSLPTGVKPSAIAVGQDGNIWFGVDYGKIAHTTPSGTDFTSFTIPNATTSVVAGLTTAADGNLWFTLDRTDSIGRITPQGVITLFPLPTTNARAGGITAGGDGNVWFLEGAGKIGRVTPSGTTTEFPVSGVLGGDGAPLSSACLGPDNNVWFTEYIGSKVARITPQGVLTEWPTPKPSSYPSGITTGPDGNLWFVAPGAPNAQEVVRVTPSGVFTEFPTNYAGSVDLAQITSGPDGNLWVTEYNSNRIARVTTAGVISQFDVPTTNAQSGFITASSSALWFSEHFSGKIGRLIP